MLHCVRFDISTMLQRQMPTVAHGCRADAAGVCSGWSGTRPSAL